ncbi:L-ribulose-5-phosphate 4-epimerase [Thermoanaerobacterium thermosaccharolyticum]|uniref:L-ribulose-5-phosphate 4-epimerase n=1 Tax=Thermoanaerobacterium thermosaccharolyticum (strain ATCC 7956 / DSM 571 / NCIMB 9385 / NCA 3814 / NCTC 13789 / WDCM 00135 / 2032) TaxID=580327 RepID=D9TT85_THETC|nr:L-ribulose-5-phosphate 4-epimerase [Thermoanaerobacterium thermosaccharolyticum]ADL68227.1 class II aldolase/adducin family protein [Thermoanaerobacterium thermosaccharolyticum DSM 571]KAA5808419.1 L-ribulose-5-phosphate 4-epimerase [Thermoanaerobacterium thermosaccharolyticum]MCP2240935.1 L-ribulose-5-phosphate 4-epimerase [Thermoanaerobacterium thermosaccharolyticum]
MLEQLKQRVYKMNMMLPKNNLVTMTSGNVSGRDPDTGLVVIKPSGVLYDDMTPDDMVVVDLDGNVVEGKLKPSVDTATHLYVYKHRNDVNGIVHTHSPYATSFAALGRSIPVYLTAIADEFGCAIPVGPYAKIGGEEIGKAIVEYIGESPAILMKNHGVFTIGNTPEAALKAAVMVEDTAKTVHLALLLGTPDVIPDEEVKRAHERYLTKYGQ